MGMEIMQTVLPMMIRVNEADAFAMNDHIAKNGNPVCLIQHRRLREYPPSGGVSVYCESMKESPDLFERSVALLRAFEWEGVAMVEYRYDELSGN
jgi:predicted ATP-grasp superfamily ATP-dependent carboligase